MARHMAWVVRMVLAMWTAALWGCASGAHDEPSAPDEKEPQLTLRFAIATVCEPRAASRAFEELAGMASENYIDVNDLRVLLFDDSKLLLTDLTSRTRVIDQIGDPSTGYTVYILQSEFNSDYFFPVTTVDLPFYLMVMANGRSMGMGFTAIAPGTSISELCASSPVMTATPVTAQLQTTTGHQHFPMAGIRRFAPSVADLEASTPDDPLDISDTDKPIEMLRALAKIEVIDATSNPENAIAAGALHGFMAQGAILPPYDQWSVAPFDIPQTAQVSLTGIPSRATYERPSQAYNYVPFSGTEETIALQRDEAASTRAGGRPVYSCYLWEYDQTRAEGAPHPFIEIICRNGLRKGMLLAEYADGNPTKSLDQILRNYIYRYEIVEINADGYEGSLKANWTVCPMDEIVVDIPEFN